MRRRRRQRRSGREEERLRRCWWSGGWGGGAEAPPAGSSVRGAVGVRCCGSSRAACSEAAEWECAMGIELGTRKLQRSLALLCLCPATKWESNRERVTWRTCGLKQRLRHSLVHAEPTNGQCSGSKCQTRTNWLQKNLTSNHRPRGQEATAVSRSAWPRLTWFSHRFLLEKFSLVESTAKSDTTHLLTFKPNTNEVT